MHADIREPAAAIVPILRYRDLATAIDWLCRAFGFACHHVVKGEDGTIRYAELRFGSGMVMLGPVADSAFDKLMTQPADAGGAETQICYLYVADAREHCARARAAGAEILLDIEGDGSARGYSCRDPEGHIWNFGTYDPWRRRAGPAAADKPRRGGSLQRIALAATLLVGLAGSAAIVAWAVGGEERGAPAHGPGPPETAAAAPDAGRLADEAARERAGREAAERAAKALQGQLAHAQGAKDAAERAAREAQAQLAREREAREAAERAAREARERLARSGDTGAAAVREELARQRAALESAQRVIAETREQLSLVERAAEATREQLEAERGAREAAERAGREAREALAREQEAAERAKQQAQLAKERAAKEARERREQSARRAAPRRSEPSATSAPFMVWGQ